MSDSPKPRRPRVPPDLAARIDAVRGDVPFEVWVRRALERALAGAAEGAGSRKVADPVPVDLSGSRGSAAPARASDEEAMDALVGPVVAPGLRRSAPAAAPTRRVDPDAAARMQRLNKTKGL